MVETMKGLEGLAEIILNEAIKASQTEPKQKQEEPETKLADASYKQFEAFRCAGFTDEQSFELLLKIIDKAVRVSFPAEESHPLL
jgi:hypothetical protein